MPGVLKRLKKRDACLKNEIGMNFGNTVGPTITVGTKMIADPEKCFQEFISEKLLIFFAGRALFGINYRFQ